MVSEFTSLSGQFSRTNFQIGHASAATSRNIAQLSSGERITRAADDIASLSVASRMTGRVIALRSAAINISQAASYLGVSDGALAEIEAILQRMNAITVQANGGGVSNVERGFLNQEFQNLYQETDRIVQETNFNGVHVFDDHFVATSLSAAFSIPGDSLSVAANPVVHFDPTDATTVIDGAGLNAAQVGFDPTDVAQLLDISGNSNHVTQGNAAERPDYIADINGGTSDGIQFDGINDRMTGTVPTTTQQLTTFIVYTRTGGGGSREFLFEFGSNPENARDIIGSVGTEPLYFNAVPFGGGAQNDFGVNVPFGQYTLMSTSLDVGELDTFIDGTQILDQNLAGGRERDPTTAFTLGDDWTSGDETTGVIAELIAYDRILTADERQQIEGLLAQKHGLNLPSSHPYASSGLSLVEGETFALNDFVSKDDVIGKLRPTIAGASAAYTITNGNDGAFRINSKTGEVLINDPTRLQFDQPNYALTIEATLSTGQVQQLEMTIELGFSGLLYQTDRETSSRFEIDLEEMNTEDVFGADPIDVNTQESAQAAQVVIGNAIDVITNRRALVGAKMSAADSAASGIGDALRNQQFARGVVADADIAQVTTALTQNLVKQTASISIAAQAVNLRDSVVLNIIDNGTEIDSLLDR